MSHASTSRRSTGQRRKALARASGSALPSFDDWQEAYEEAAGHLEYVAGCGTQEDIFPGEREAMRRLATRLRASAKRMKPNVKDEPCAPKEDGR